jgi:hypothetical protein
MVEKLSGEALAAVRSENLRKGRESAAWFAARRNADVRRAALENLCKARAAVTKEQRDANLARAQDALSYAQRCAALEKARAVLAARRLDL